VQLIAAEKTTKTRLRLISGLENSRSIMPAAAATKTPQLLPLMRRAAARDHPSTPLCALAPY